MALPEFARDDLSNELRLTEGVGMLEDLAKQPEIKLAPPQASNLALYMNSERTTSVGHINSIYWAVSPSALRGVLDQVRTALVQLVAEMRSGMPSGQDVPSKEEVDQAVNVVVTGERARVKVTTNQASGGSVATSHEGSDDSSWSRLRLVGAALAGLATIAAAVFAAIEAF